MWSETGQCFRFGQCRRVRTVNFADEWSLNRPQLACRFKLIR